MYHKCDAVTQAAMCALNKNKSKQVVSSEVKEPFKNADVSLRIHSVSFDVAAFDFPLGTSRVESRTSDDNV